MSATTKTKKAPSFAYALFTVLLTFSIIMIPAVFLGAKTQPLFLVSWMIAIPLCMKLGYTYKELQQGMMAYMSRSLTAMTIVLCVGAMIGTWNASGTVPLITKLGLQVINPKYFMLTSYIICLVFSVFTGTSFGTCGTAGVALMGVGLSMGLDPMKVAMPIITAAYFGDAISPMSDSTNGASASVGTDLFETVKYQATTTVPAMVIAGVLFFFWGMGIDTSGADVSTITEVIKGIDANWKLGIVPALPLVVVLALLLMKVPSIPSVLSGALTGFLVAWLYQGINFKDVTLNMWSGFVCNTGDAFLDKIFSRGGITSMSGTAFLFVFAFGLFGVLSTAGVVDKVVEPLTRKCKGRVSGAICTIILGFIANVTSASGNFSFIFTGSLMRPVYENAGLNKWDLTRAMSVGCLLSGLIIPWNSNPLTVCGFLGVDTAAMIPYMSIPLICTFVVVMFYSITNIDKKFSKKARGEE
ncbi:MAG: Na+/H+ antiporter NhaC family protein [Candidatus Heteroscillospira sp.]|jgi:NhaC family Na+:H+ antiporter